MAVPTVDRSVRPRRFWSITTEVDRFSMSSTSGLLSLGSRRRANELNVSMSWRWASVWTVSNTSDDLPDPDTPTKATRASRGMSSETSFRLWTRAPLIRIDSGIATRLGLGRSLCRHQRYLSSVCS